MRQSRGFSDFNYRNDGRLTELYHRVSESTSSAKIATYLTTGYDSAGRLTNPTTELFSRADGTRLVHESKVYDYDTVGQLRFVKTTDNTPAGDPIVTYTPFKFDANGNPDLGPGNNGADNRNYSHDADSSSQDLKYDVEGR